MRRFKKTLGLGLALAAVSACAGEDERKGGNQTPGGTSGTGLEVCAASAPGTPMLRRLTAREMQATLEDVFPVVAGSWTNSLSADPTSHYGYDNEAERLVVGRQKAREIDATAESVAKAVTGPALPEVLPCAGSGADRACAEEFLDKYGKRLFRRPLEAGERAQLLAFFDEAAAKTSFSEGIGWLTRALIHAPQTIYRSEIGALASGERTLSQYEVATALSYTFAGTTPNDELLALADRGELTSRELLVQAARELMQMPRGRQNLHHLFGAWLEYPRVTTVTKANVDGFEEIRQHMREETRRFLELVVFEQGGGLADLLTTPQTTPSLALAEFYRGGDPSFPSPATDYAAVERPPLSGIGVLAQGSILATKSLPSGSSPTQRGLLVMENFLCRTPPVVPPDVPILPEPTEGQVTTRQRYEELHATGACKNCHRQFDPIGYGFEHFDEVGRYRSEEHGLSIDASGEVPNSFTFEGQADLAYQLAQDAEVQACVSARVKAYAFGTEEACLGETQRGAFMSGAVGFVEYLASLAAEPQFSRRKAQ